MADRPQANPTPQDWQALLARIKQGQCTPLLGAGLTAGALPLPGEIARRWAKEYDYPLDDADNLASVAHYLAVQYDARFPAEMMALQVYWDVRPPDFSQLDEPYRVLAELPLPLYVTTTYDDFMLEALARQNKSPRRALCRWNPAIQDDSPFLDPAFEPTVRQPLVYHLFGHYQTPESVVLSQADYWRFLVNLARDPDPLPYQIRRALGGSSLLALGYSTLNWDYRVLLRSLVTSTESSLRRLSLTVQPPPEPEPEAERARDYLARSFSRAGMLVYWGSPRAFAAELRHRWESFATGS